MKTGKKITVIIPCYNQAHYITEALESVRKQTFSNWECFIIDDGSIDATREKVIPFVRSDHRFQYFFQTNKGVAYTRNRGLDMASGDYIQFLDSDDYLDEPKFELQLEQILQEKSLAVVSCDYRILHGPSGRMRLFRISPFINRREPLKDLILNWEVELSIPPHSLLFDARIFKEYGLRFDQDLKNHEDWDCWVSVLRCNPKFLIVPKKLATYRIHPMSMMRSGIDSRAGFEKAIQKQLKLCEAGSREHQLLERKLADLPKFYGPIGKYRRFARIAWRILKDLKT
jgi:glycosyltransferase involved in cell wall biosynthesis